MCKFNSPQYHEKISIVLRALRGYKGRYVDVDTVRCKIKELSSSDIYGNINKNKNKKQFSFTNDELKTFLTFLVNTKKAKVQYYQKLKVYSINE